MKKAIEMEIIIVDTNFSQQTVEDLSASLVRIDGEVKDVTFVAVIKGGIQVVIGLMQQYHKAYKAVDYFVNKAIRDEFRIGELQKVRSNQLWMIDIMESISTALNKYSAVLIENGMPQAKIDAIIPLAEQLMNVNSEQEVSKDGRPVGTHSRIESLNDLYKQPKQISDAAPMVFEDNEAKIKAYKLPAA